MQHDAAYKQDLQEVRNEVQKMGLLVEKLLSSREAGQKHEVPDEATTLLKNELADVKEENGKLKDEQLPAPISRPRPTGRSGSWVASVGGSPEHLKQSEYS